MQDHQFVFESTVSGIPCQIGVIEYVKGSYDLNSASDSDYYGISEWEVLDRKGYHAPWLAKKLKENDYSRIDQEIVDHIEYLKDNRY